MLRSVSAFAVSALACLTPAAGAQRWEVGGKTGLSHVGVSSGEFEWSRSNSATGAFFRGILSERFAVSNELIMTRRVGISVLPASTLSLTAEYVELPLMVQARLASRYGLAPFLSAGPSLVLRTRCRLRFVGGGLSTDNDCDDARYATNTMDYALNGGGGIIWSPGLVTLSVEGRYMAGIRDNVMPTGVATSRARGWSAFGGVSVPLYRQRSVPRPGLPSPAPVFAQAGPPERLEPSAPRAGDTTVAAEDPMARRITVDAADVELRDVFAGIAQAAGVPIMVSPLVRGRITIALTSVPVASALAAIVDMARIAMTRSLESGEWVVRIDPLPRGER